MVRAFGEAARFGSAPSVLNLQRQISAKSRRRSNVPTSLLSPCGRGIARADVSLVQVGVRGVSASAAALQRATTPRSASPRIARGSCSPRICRDHVAHQSGRAFDPHKGPSKSFQTAVRRSGIQEQTRCCRSPGFQIALRASGMTKQNASDEGRSHASWSARFQAREGV